MGTILLLILKMAQPSINQLWCILCLTLWGLLTEMILHVTQLQLYDISVKCELPVVFIVVSWFICCQLKCCT